MNNPVPNFLSPLEFKVIIKRMPNVEFFTQRTSIPSVSATPVTRHTPFNPTFVSPDNLTYSNLDLSFIIDENMNNYIEIFNWLVSLTFPQSFDQFKKLKESDEGLYSDIGIIILNSKKNANIEVTYHKCFPIMLSEVALDTTMQDLQYSQANVVFQYDHFSISNK